VSAPPPNNLQQWADALYIAERDVAPLPTSIQNDLDENDAYAIQELNTKRRAEDGAHLVGRKVGLTSQAMQTFAGIVGPMHGALFDVMAAADSIDLEQLIMPRVEAEIAFVLGKDLVGPGVTEVDARRAIETVVPSIEVLDSRCGTWELSLAQFIADNASAARFCVGGVFASREDRDLRLIGVALHRNGQVVETGAGAAVLGNPVRSLAWLANKLAESDEALWAGELVLPGALHRAVDVLPGDVFTAEFAGLGSVSVRFKESPPDWS
jgi:2-keto-4-pentenoate hydratase